MPIQIESPLRRAFPLIDVGQGFHEIRSINGKVLFSLHQVDPNDPFVEGLSGTFISEGIGAADALLPDEFAGMTFEDPEAAYNFCMQALETISACLNGKIAA